jgi:hypothetical protein
MRSIHPDSQSFFDFLTDQGPKPKKEGVHRKKEEG